MKKSIVFMGFALFVLLGHAQESNWTFLSAGNKILSSSAQGKDVWVGTSNGLAYMDYNTKEITNFYYCNSPFPNNTINDIKKDSEGNFWFASGTSIAKFDGREWEYIDLGDNIFYGTIMEIDFDNNGDLWVVTTNEVMHYDFEVWTVYDDSSTDVYITFANDIAFDSKDNVWVSSMYGLLKFDGAKWTVFDESNSSIPTDYLTNLAIDNTDKIWIGGLFESLFTFNGVSWTVVDIDAYSCYAVESDGQGRIWVDASDGFWVFDGANYTEYTTSDGLSDLSVNGFSFDGDIAWIATWNGLNRFDGKEFEYFTFPTSGLADDNINTMEANSKGEIWCGTNFGISVYNQGEWLTFDDELDNYWPAVNDIKFNDNNEAWIGGMFTAAYYDGSDFILYDNINSGLDLYFVYELAWDTERDIVWFAGSDELYSYDYDVFTYYAIDDLGLDILSYSSIEDILVDHAGRLFVSTSSSGVLTYFEGRWSHFNEENSALYDDWCYGLGIDDSGKVFVGHSGGFSVYYDSVWTPYYWGNSDYPGGLIDAFYTLSEGAMWFGTGERLIKYDGEGSFESFAIPIDQFTSDLEKDVNGNLWVSGDNGLGIFNPDGLNIDFSGLAYDYMGNPLTEGSVILFNNTKLIGGYDTVAIAPIQADGSYTFDGISNCAYTVQIKPTIANRGALMSTYLGSEALWTAASSVSAYSNHALESVEMQPVPQQTSGEAAIEGSVVNNIYRGEPVKSTTVILEHVARSIVAYTETDQNGNFELPNIPVGEYYLTVDYPGIKMDDDNLIAITAANQIVDVEVKVSDTLVTFNEGVAVPRESTLQFVRFYPNPVEDILFVDLFSEVPSSHTVEILDVTGKVLQIVELSLSEGKNETIRLSLGDYAKGMYVVSISDNEGSVIRNLFVKK
jgi:ligand-binding sensor domain-containing protein